MRILLTGGVGFIGSHTLVELLKKRHDVIVVDNKSNSSLETLNYVDDLARKNVKFVYIVDIRRTKFIEDVLREWGIEAVIHFAGSKSVGESCEKPLDYYDNNVGGTISLLRAMERAGVKRLIFSSSATVYGSPTTLPITEEHPTGNTTNPYGKTKVIIEDMLKDYCSANPDFKVICLRYFNPIGAHPSGLIGENPRGIPNNLVPYVARVASGRLKKLSIFGGDYETHDGTGVRDYIHVVDLVNGHIAALNHIDEFQGWNAFNLGTGKGYSVLDVVHAYEKACGKKIPYEIVERRPGDVAAVWADASKAKNLLGWTAKLGLNKMCEDSWRYEQFALKNK